MKKLLYKLNLQLFADPAYTHQARKTVMVISAKADGSGVEATDLTELAQDLVPELRMPSPEDSMFNSMANTAKDPTGFFTYEVGVIKEWTKIKSSVRLNGQDKKNSRVDKTTIEFDEDYTQSYQYKKSIDLVINQYANLPARDLGSLTQTMLTMQRKAFWDVFYTEVVKAQNLVNRSDVAYTIPANAAVSAIANGDTLADAIILKIDEVSKYGLSTNTEYPYAEGVPYSQQIIVTNIVGLNEISKDERFVHTDSGETMVRTGQVGRLLTTPVIVSPLVDKTLATKQVKAVLMPVGQRSPIGLFEREGLSNKIVEAQWHTFSELQTETNWEVKEIKEFLPLCRVVTA